MARQRKYSDDEVREAAATSRSFSETILKLGKNPGSGGMQEHIRHRVAQLGLDITHFVGKGKGWSRGVGLTKRQKTPSTILVKQVSGVNKTRTYQLVRALIESGVEHVCAECTGPPEWRGRPLTLQVDHINGDNRDHRRENLRFLCPNCHTQTPNYGNKKRF